MAPRKCAAPSLVRISLGPAATPLTSAFLYSSYSSNSFLFPFRFC
jgi:hypothetical protein